MIGKIVNFLFPCLTPEERLLKKGYKPDGKFCTVCGNPTFTKMKVKSYDPNTGKPIMKQVRKCSTWDSHNEADNCFDIEMP